MSDVTVEGRNDRALFTLKLHRGESMVLLAMNWKERSPPDDFAGFCIEYKEPGEQKYWPVKNRLSFLGADGVAHREILSSRFSPIQKFRWVHFPMHAEKGGEFTYRVTPVFMNERDELSYGEFQEAAIRLGLETYEGELNVAFTRGFVSSQGFVRQYEKEGHTIAELLPAHANEGLGFKPTHPDAASALKWMGFEAREVILALLDEALADTDPDRRVYAIAYDLNEPEVVERLERFGDKLQVIIDDSDDHGKPGSAENEAAARLVASAGQQNVLRQHMRHLQHNKVIVVDGPRCKAVVCGSTNFSWRAFYVQANNALVLRGAGPVAVFRHAFDAYWQGVPGTFQSCPSTGWTPLGLAGVDGSVTFSPHSKSNAVLGGVAKDLEQNAQSSVLFSLAFLAKTTGSVRDAIDRLVQRDEVFVYGMSDSEVRGIDLDTADGHFELTEPANLGPHPPEPFASEPSGGGGIRMHHKFVVVDFNTPKARVYMGSFNFSGPADVDNGENLLLLKDRRVATAYMVEALRLFDHYEFRVKQQEADSRQDTLHLRKPPRAAGELAWWGRYWSDRRRIRDRELFS